MITNTDCLSVKFGAPADYGYGAVYGNPVAIAYYNNNRNWFEIYLVHLCRSKFNKK
jgi:hypothetical protein